MCWFSEQQGRSRSHQYNSGESFVQRRMSPATRELDHLQYPEARITTGIWWPQRRNYNINCRTFINYSCFKFHSKPQFCSPCRLLEIDASVSEWPRLLIILCNSTNKDNNRIFSCAWYISTCTFETMTRWLAGQTFLTRKIHLRWGQLISHNYPEDLHRFLCISLITTRHFNGNNPDTSLTLGN